MVLHTLRIPGASHTYRKTRSMHWGTYSVCNIVKPSALWRCWELERTRRLEQLLLKQFVLCTHFTLPSSQFLYPFSLSLVSYVTIMSWCQPDNGEISGWVLADRREAIGERDCQTTGDRLFQDWGKGREETKCRAARRRRQSMTTGGCSWSNRCCLQRGRGVRLD